MLFFLPLFIVVCICYSLAERDTVPTVRDYEIVEERNRLDNLSKQHSELTPYEEFYEMANDPVLKDF
jgi:cell division protein FtsL